MNYQKQKSNPAFRAFQEVLKRIGEDRSLFATHVSLFTAMFICWQRNAFQSPFMVNRRMLMGYSKIASKATYHKCIRDFSKEDTLATGQVSMQYSPVRFGGWILEN